MIFRTSPQADEDIADAYIAGAMRFGVAKADRYQDGLFATAARIGRRPSLDGASLRTIRQEWGVRPTFRPGFTVPARHWSHGVVGNE